jgi:hypothetical protein
MTIKSIAMRTVQNLHVSLLATTCLSCLAVTAATAQTPSFGPNVIILDPSMPPAQVQSTLDSLWHEDQFSTNRYAVLFKPGTYTLDTQVGYYESVAGLGLLPGDVVINGGVRAEATLDPGGQTDNATQDFWRSEENFTVVPTGGQTRWAVSQGAPFRRMHIMGSISLAGALYGWASGGFISDSLFDGQVGPYSQQQWYTRNSVLNGWVNAVWNMVFSGVVGAPAQSFPNPTYTTLETTPVSREKPFLFVDGSGNYNVFAPAVKRDSAGTTWSSGAPAGRTIPISQFLIATPSTDVTSINLALASGLNLILTPGIYQYSQAIHVTTPDTVVLGMGYATLVPQAGTEALAVDDVDGVQVAGLIIDAGPVTSPVLLRMGSQPAAQAATSRLARVAAVSHAADPSAVSDVFFRIGGATVGSAVTSLEVDSSDVIIDDLWAWRADHGNGIGWTQNTADHGLVVNGDNVSALGLAVEHYQKSQVVWNGNGGTTLFYQSELPYDVPGQAAWMNGTANGYPSYSVSANVTTHQAYGLGVYSFFNQGVNIIEDSAITVPTGSPGTQIHDAATVLLSGSGAIEHIVNDAGPIANVAGSESTLISYP